MMIQKKRTSARCFETESETSDKEAENYKCAICQKMYIDKTELIEHVELCDVEENKESEEIFLFFLNVKIIEKG